MSDVTQKEMKKRVLHADDEPDTLSVVKTILEKEGFEVTSVKNGKETLEEMERSDFDVILLDIMMPDISGWELFTRITEMKPKYKVIFLTVLEVSPDRLRELKEHGIKDYITKPFDQADLVKKVNAALVG